MLKLKTIQDTVFKLKPQQSSELNNSEKITIKNGEILAVDEATAAPSSHVRVKLKTPLLFGGVEYSFAFAFSGHVKIFGQDPQNKSVRLNVPYKSQLDNRFNPTGSCNVTSVAMCLEYYGVRAKSGQLEDQLYQEMLDLGLSRHDPNDLACMVQRYGLKDKFTPYGAVENVKAWLAEGKPVVTHGYFTSFGHIIVLVGYDENGWIVHDPYGEWFSWGYDRNDERNNEKGKYLHYSYGLIQRTCMPDGDFWVHFISK